jgi:hypothetical protein
METVQRSDWNGAKTKLSAAEWMDYVESKAGNYQVLIDGIEALHYPCAFDVAYPSFAYLARRNGGRVVLVEAGTR